eukprot:SM000021S06513  [mRNA]  locus=s21:926773:928110:+ [translate_table: standard]
MTPVISEQPPESMTSSVADAQRPLDSALDRPATVSEIFRMQILDRHVPYLGALIAGLLSISIIFAAHFNQPQ